MLALVAGAVGERGVERDGVAGGEERLQLARRPASRPLALHGDDGVDDREARPHGEVEVEQHVGEVLAPLSLDVELGLGEPGDARRR